MLYKRGYAKKKMGRGGGCEVLTIIINKIFVIFEKFINNLGTEIKTQIKLIQKDKV